ncbi:ATP synthase F0 subunit B [Streptomyces sp. SID14446]|uniref:ATP synthase F0 subunit B n=1 Tax=Streptomyces sp. SID14446 TaxID=2706072 RepID=UPI0013BB64DD|nr:ATP synthase F0 subunit B [Streptomyces sp. SID14446]NEB32800.1 ATP synthase F0 subunit B [Streptomyces sp. SID14446]
MAESSPGEVEDSAELAAYREALHDFADELNRLHISFGAPPYREMVRASVRPKLTNAGINEALTGRRLPSQETLLEFVRVVSTLTGFSPGAAGARLRPDLAAHWRGRWQDVKLRQRQAQAPLRHLRATVRELVDTAREEAEEIRTAAHEDAVRIRGAAEADAERLREQAASEAAELRQQAALPATAPDPKARKRDVAEVALRGEGRRGLISRLGGRRWVPAAVVGALAVASVTVYAVTGGFGGQPDSCTSALERPAGVVVRGGTENGRGTDGVVNQAVLDSLPQAFITIFPGSPTRTFVSTPPSTPDPDPTPSTSPTPTPSASPTTTARSGHRCR